MSRGSQGDLAASPNASATTAGWLQEVRITFDREELDDFFDGFSPMDSATDLLDRLFGAEDASSMSAAA